MSQKSIILVTIIAIALFSTLAATQSQYIEIRKSGGFIPQVIKNPRNVIPSSLAPTEVVKKPMHNAEEMLRKIKGPDKNLSFQPSPLLSVYFARNYTNEEMMDKFKIARHGAETQYNPEIVVPALMAKDPNLGPIRGKKPVKIIKKYVFYRNRSKIFTTPKSQVIATAIKNHSMNGDPKKPKTKSQVSTLKSKIKPPSNMLKPPRVDVEKHQVKKEHVKSDINPSLSEEGAESQRFPEISPLPPPVPQEPDYDDPPNIVTVQAPQTLQKSEMQHIGSGGNQEGHHDQPLFFTTSVLKPSQNDPHPHQVMTPTATNVKHSVQNQNQNQYGYQMQKHQLQSQQQEYRTLPLEYLMPQNHLQHNQASMDHLRHLPNNEYQYQTSQNHNHQTISSNEYLPQNPHHNTNHENHPHHNNPSSDHEHPSHDSSNSHTSTEHKHPEHEASEARITLSKTFLGSKTLKKGTALVVLAAVLVVFILAGLATAGAALSPISLPLAVLPIALLAFVLFIPLIILFVPLVVAGLAGGKRRRKKRSVDADHDFEQLEWLNRLISKDLKF